MKITLEVPDSFLPSLQAHVREEQRADNDPVTQNQRLRPVYADADGAPSIAAFFSDLLTQAVHQVALKRPEGEHRKLVEAQKAQMDAMKKAATVVVTVG